MKTKLLLLASAFFLLISCEKKLPGSEPPQQEENPLLKLVLGEWNLDYREDIEVCGASQTVDINDLILYTFHLDEDGNFKKFGIPYHFEDRWHYRNYFGTWELEGDTLVLEYASGTTFTSSLEDGPWSGVQFQRERVQYGLLNELGTSQFEFEFIYPGRGGGCCDYPNYSIITEYFSR